MLQGTCPCAGRYQERIDCEMQWHSSGRLVLVMLTHSNLPRRPVDTSDNSAPSARPVPRQRHTITHTLSADRSWNNKSDNDSCRGLRTTTISKSFTTFMRGTTTGSSEDALIVYSFHCFATESSSQSAEQATKRSGRPSVRTATRHKHVAFPSSKDCESGSSTSGRHHIQMVTVTPRTAAGVTLADSGVTISAKETAGLTSM